MRLIDADKLKAHYAWWGNEEREVFDSIVDMQPTVMTVDENEVAKLVRIAECVERVYENKKRGECVKPICVGSMRHSNKYNLHPPKEILACPICGEIGVKKYCPKCGAKMDGDDKKGVTNDKQRI